MPVDPGRDHVRGPEDAVVLLLYGDYECPYTTAAYRSVQELERAAGEPLRFAFRHFPLTDVHARARAAAEAAEAASLQDRFWQMHEVLFDADRALEPADLRRHAATAGVDPERFESDLASGAGSGRVDEDLASGRASGVGGTPWIFVDGVHHEGGHDPASLREAVESSRATARGGGLSRVAWSLPRS